jgi:hypothetical protein
MKMGVEQASQSRKIYKFTMARQTVAANNRAVLTTSYVSDDLFYLENNYIVSRYTGTILVTAHIIGAPTGSIKRLWCTIAGDGQISYGDFCTANVAKVVQTAPGSSIGCNFTEGFDIGAGGVGEGHIAITILD